MNKNKGLPQAMINHSHWQAHLSRVFKRNPKNKPRTHIQFTRMIKVNGESRIEKGSK